MSFGAKELKCLIDANTTRETTYGDVINQLLGNPVEQINHAEDR